MGIEHNIGPRQVRRITKGDDEAFVDQATDLEPFKREGWEPDEKWRPDGGPAAQAQPEPTEDEAPADGRPGKATGDDGESAGRGKRGK